MKAKIVTVDGFECSKESVLKEPANKESLTKEELSLIENIKVGESFYFGMGVEIKGVK